MSKNALNDGMTHVGVIAQEIQSGSIGKWAISTGPDGYLRYDPNAVLYSLVNSVKTLDAKKSNTGSILDITNSLSGITSNISTLFDTVSIIQSKISTLSGSTSIVNNYTTNIIQTGSVSPGNNISTEDQSVLDAIIGAINSLIIEVGVTFQEIATFMKSVVFQSTVRFQSRVTFEDTDMAGTAIIQAGSKSVHINFNTTYTTVPKITVTGDTFVNYRVTGKNIHGFTIETQLPVGENTSFDWIALMVQ